jgi:hypothetical protein
MTTEEATIVAEVVDLARTNSNRWPIHTQVQNDTTMSAADLDLTIARLNRLAKRLNEETTGDTYDKIRAINRDLETIRLKLIAIK